MVVSLGADRVCWPAGQRRAFEEGRGVFDNLSKFIGWILPTNAGIALILLIAITAGITLPMLPTQLLWLNLVTALFLGLTLVAEWLRFRQAQPASAHEP